MGLGDIQILFNGSKLFLEQATVQESDWIGWKAPIAESEGGIYHSNLFISQSDIWLNLVI